LNIAKEEFIAIFDADFFTASRLVEETVIYLRMKRFRCGTDPVGHFEP